MPFEKPVSPVGGEVPSTLYAATVDLPALPTPGDQPAAEVVPPAIYPVPVYDDPPKATTGPSESISIEDRGHFLLDLKLPWFGRITVDWFRRACRRRTS